MLTQAHRNRVAAVHRHHCKHSDVELQKSEFAFLRLVRAKDLCLLSREKIYQAYTYLHIHFSFVKHTLAYFGNSCFSHTQMIRQLDGGASTTPMIWKGGRLPCAWGVFAFSLGAGGVYPVFLPFFA